MEFKEILMEYLQLNSLKQTEFAKMIDVKQSQVSEWLDGKAKPGYETMRKILQNTDKTAAFWFDLDS